jgi:hypothetical protein
MQIKVSIVPFSIVKYLIIGVIFFTIATIGINVSKYVFNYDEEWTNMLNLDREMNFPTWYSAFMLGFGSILLRIIATGKKQASDRHATDWKLLSLIFTLLAIDEVISIHEIFIIPEVSNALNLPWFLHSMWVIPGTIFVVWFLKRYWKFSRHLPLKSQQHFIAAAGVYIGGALLMEMVGSYVAEAQGQQHLFYALITTVEEAMEMVGIIIFIYGLLYYLNKWAKDLNLQIEFLGSQRDTVVKRGG